MSSLECLSQLVDVFLFLFIKEPIATRDESISTQRSKFKFTFFNARDTKLKQIFFNDCSKQ